MKATSTNCCSHCSKCNTLEGKPYQLTDAYDGFVIDRGVWQYLCPSHIERALPISWHGMRFDRLTTELTSVYHHLCGIPVSEKDTCYTSIKFGRNKKLAEQLQPSEWDRFYLANVLLQPT